MSDFGSREIWFAKVTIKTTFYVHLADQDNCRILSNICTPCPCDHCVSVELDPSGPVFTPVASRFPS